MYTYRFPDDCFEVLDLTLEIDTLNDKSKPYTWKGSDIILVSLTYNESLKLAVRLQ
jgi:hypothetical protein